MNFHDAEKTTPLVSTTWLAEHLGSTDIVVLDASFFLPNQNRDAKAEYRQGHIPGALFFDIDAVADHATNLPHMLPSPEEFAEAVGKMGIGKDTLVVAYDSNFFMASARVWCIGSQPPPWLRWMSSSTEVSGHRRKQAARTTNPTKKIAGIRS